jgi:hypothetical protein
VQYIGANVPQAWAAGFMLLQAMLGLQEDEVLKGKHDAVARRSYASGNYLPADEELSAPDLDEELIRLRHPSH